MYRWPTSSCPAVRCRASLAQQDELLASLRSSERRKRVDGGGSAKVNVAQILRPLILTAARLMSIWARAVVMCATWDGGEPGWYVRMSPVGSLTTVAAPLQLAGLP